MMIQWETGRAGKILVTFRAVHSYTALKEYGVRFYLRLMVGEQIQRQYMELHALLELR
jgi:hypothetical protein